MKLAEIGRKNIWSVKVGLHLTTPQTVNYSASEDTNYNTFFNLISNYIE